MKRIIYVLCAFSLVLSCNDSNSKGKEQTVKAKVAYDMYEASEMTLLMREMFDKNKEIKKAIIAQKAIGKFPDEFLGINTAKMSKFKVRDQEFNSFASAFLSAEKEIFNTNSQTEAKERFNNAINLCIVCHQTECSGPIPKISRLLIK